MILRAIKWFLFEFGKNDAPRPLSNQSGYSKFKKEMEGKLLVEVLKTKINRHKIVHIGPTDEFPDRIMVGIQFQRKDSYSQTYYYSSTGLQEDARLQSYKLVSSEEADEIERRIKESKKTKPKS